MIYSNDAFKAEVRHRGRLRVLERKRNRKKVITCICTLVICLTAAVLLLPNLDMIGGIAPKEDGMAMSPDADVRDEAVEMEPPADADAPIENKPSDGEEPGEHSPGYVTSVYSVEVNSRGNDGFSILHTDADHLVEIGCLFKSINESGRDASPDGNAGGSNTDYRITVTYRFDDQDEYIWSGMSWYIVDEDRTVALTVDEVEALTTLLLQSEAN